MTKVPAGYLSSAEAAVLAGITYRQLDFWAGSGWLHPERVAGSGPAGSGVPRAWPEGEVQAAVRMGKLVRAGLTVPVAAVVARAPEAPEITGLLAMAGVVPECSER